MGAIQRAINQVAGMASIYTHLYNQSPARQAKLQEQKKEASKTTSLQSEMSKAAQDRVKAQRDAMNAQRAELKKAYDDVRSYNVGGRPIKDVDPALQKAVLKSDVNLQNLVKKAMELEKGVSK